MKVLGLVSDFHDSSAALVIDGKLVATSVEERFTRNKHDAAFPRFATEFCLAEAGIEKSELDLVVFYERPFKKWLRVTDMTLKAWPHSRHEFVEAQSEWLGRKLWTNSILVNKMGLHPDKVLEVDHHHSHAMQAFVGSGFPTAAILTIDAAGEDSAATFSLARWKNGRPEFQALGESPLPHSLGLFYSAMTAFLGFKPMNDECTTMALAAFGLPRYADRLREILKLDASGFWTIDESYLDFNRFLSAPWLAPFTDLMGEPRAARANLSFSSFEKRVVSAEEQHWADVAASVQLVFEEAVLHSARHLARVTGETRLCFAGGAALNCVVNTRLLRESGFSRVHIPVEPGDGGASIGAAYAGYYAKAVKPVMHLEPHSVYQGARGRRVDDLLEHLDIKHSWEYHKHGVRADRREWTWETIDSDIALAKMVAQEIARDRVVGIFRGRFEMGPRALGHRSLLFRPDSLPVAQRVSRDIKDRAEFRPYALAISESDAADVLDAQGIDYASTPMRWMQTAIAIRPTARERLRTGSHIDGTTRPQVVNREETPFLNAILSQMKLQTGIAAVINTSMNESGYPLVGSSEEALLMFARTSLDTLVIDNLLIRKADA